LPVRPQIPQCITLWKKHTPPVPIVTVAAPGGSAGPPANMNAASELLPQVNTMSSTWFIHLVLACTPSAGHRDRAA
jgi:hypothetical protein